MSIYIITEPYDGTHVRILACARTPQAAERQLERQRRARSRAGYLFFAPLRRVIASRRAVENALDCAVSTLPTWDGIVEVADA